MPYNGRTPTPSPIDASDIPAGSVDSSKILDGAVALSDISGEATVSLKSGRKNRIINGCMRVDQRNEGAAVVVTGGGYIVDRMVTNNTTNTGTYTVQQSSLGNAKSLRFTATAAVTDLTTTKTAYGLLHVIEDNNVADLNGKVITISAKVETNWAGNLPVSIINSDNTRSYVVNVAVVTGVNNIIVTLPLEASMVLTRSNSPGIGVVIGFNNEATFRTATTGSWVAGFFGCSTLSTQWAKTIGNFINVTELQLEEGDRATDFEYRPIGEELALCYRYFYKLPSAQYLYSPDEGIKHFHFPVTMRVSPTVALLTAPTGLVVNRTTPAFVTLVNATATGNVLYTASAEL